MGITAFSFILLPLCLFWATSPAKLLRLIPVFGIFEAAAALTLGSFGVQPSLVPAAAFIGYMLLQMLLGAQFSGQSQVWRVVLPFVIVTLWAVASSFVLPYIFQGTVYVWPQKPTPPFVLTPLAPDLGGLNQCIYLVTDCTFLVLAATFFRSRVSAPPFFRAYLFSGFLAAAVALWQLGSKVGGLPYPGDALYSNPGLAILTDQSMSAVPRINGTFTEPSSLAGYMCAIVCSTGWLMLRGYRDRMIRWLFLVGLLTTTLSTSTTGFGVLAMVGAGVPVYALLSGSRRMLAGILRIAMPLLIASGLLFLLADFFIPKFEEDVVVVITNTLDKQDSSSYNDRTTDDIDSLAAVVDSYGLGAGWGNNRSSSLVPGLLAGLGVPGCLGLVWFGTVITGQVRKVHPRIPREQVMVIDGCCGALVGFLLSAALSGPTVNSTTFYFLLALLIGCATQNQSRPLKSRGMMTQDHPETASVSAVAYSSNCLISSSSASDSIR